MNAIGPFAAAAWLLTAVASAQPGDSGTAVYRFKTSGSMSATLAGDVRVQLAMAGNVAKLTVQQTAKEPCLIKPAEGKWRECSAEGKLELPLTELSGGEFLVLLNRPAGLNLDDTEAPEIDSVRADGEMLPEHFDLGFVTALPKRLEVDLHDARNALDANSLRVTCDGRPVPAQSVVFEPADEARRKGTVTCDLRGISLAPLPGIRTIELTVRDQHFDTPPARLTIRFRTDANHTLPDGTQVIVDSLLQGYEDLSVLFDGKGMKPGVTTYGRTWASEETDAAHWIELLFPKEREIREVELQWANYQNTWWASARYEVQVNQQGKWATVATVTDNPATAKSTHAFAPVRTSRARVLVPGGGGHPNRPNIFWVSELTVR